LPTVYDGVYECDQQTAGFGKTVSNAGDVDADGLGDFHAVHIEMSQSSVPGLAF